LSAILSHGQQTHVEQANVATLAGSDRRICLSSQFGEQIQ
jgi:hypothetical protein|tara:strand:- start:571 stop:690 length:120 start_codon:yes stop_codon:yes gene_type:complete